MLEGSVDTGVLVFLLVCMLAWLYVSMLACFSRV